MLDFYYKELVKKYHPDLNNDCRMCTVVMKVINKLRREGKVKELENLYRRM